MLRLGQSASPIASRILLIVKSVFHNCRIRCDDRPRPPGETGHFHFGPTGARPIRGDTSTGPSKNAAEDDYQPRSRRYSSPAKSAAGLTDRRRDEELVTESTKERNRHRLRRRRCRCRALRRFRRRENGHQGNGRRSGRGSRRESRGGAQRVLQANVNAFMTAIESLETPPTELEIAFGLKVSTEIGGSWFRSSRATRTTTSRSHRRTSRLGRSAQLLRPFDCAIPPVHLPPRLRLRGRSKHP